MRVLCVVFCYGIFSFVLVLVPLTLTSKTFPPVRTDLISPSNYFHNLCFSCTDTLEHYAEFHTLPKDPSDVRFVLTHRGIINNICPQEENLWNVLESSLLDCSDDDEMEERQSLGERERKRGGRRKLLQRYLGTYSHALPTHYDHNSGSMTSDQMRSLAVGALSNQRDDGTGGDSGTSDGPDRTKSPVHFMIHCGDILSVESIVQSRSTVLLDLLLDPGSSPHTWKKGTDMLCDQMISRHSLFLSSSLL